MIQPHLPVSNILPSLCDTLEKSGRAVLVAPPGAGKTTLVPLAILEMPGVSGRILMLEPRRIAARAAAERMAALLDEPVGQSVGYRMRGDAQISAATRIEVVTEGVFTRMIQSDAALEGVSAIIFDEFHERSLHADLGLALAWEAREAMRPDLICLVMSATLEAEAVAALMDDAPIIRSDGRAFEVETRWRDRPLGGPRGDRLEEGVATAIKDAVATERGDVLVFLPGEGEIRRTARTLGEIPGVDIRPLYGALPLCDQRAALAAAPEKRRKVVLSTAIAETSLTVEGIRIVIDAGLARRARHDPASGMSRLVTERVSKAEADQRRGRAGRLESGVCYRLWTKGEEGAMHAFAPAEIEIADLAPLALDLAAWGALPEDLAFLTPPPSGAFAEARALLSQLGALDDKGRITGHGRAMAQTPAHPRLAHMILSAEPDAKGLAARIAALLEARDPLRGMGADITLRLSALNRPEGPAAGTLKRIRREGERLANRMKAGAAREGDPGPLLARAYPDRIAMRRKGGEARYLLSGGKGARIAATDALAASEILVVADLDGDAREASIRLAAPLGRADLEAVFSARMVWKENCAWSRRDRRVTARRQRMFGAVALEDQRWRDVPAEKRAAAMADGVRDLGLGALAWTPAAKRFAARVEWARSRGAEAPAMANEALMETLDIWLTPHLGDMSGAEDLARLDLLALLQAYAGWPATQTLNQVAPDTFTAPTGTLCQIDYTGAAPSISLRLQELFGLDTHPQAGGIPLTLELLSPAGRPLQTTADLPGFWRSSYADVRKDMRGRYPRHPWPEDPVNALPTRRVKPRGK